MSVNVYQVNAHWDESTGRWTATSDDIAGLVVEADNFVELREILKETAPQMLNMNAGGSPQSFALNVNFHHSLPVELPLAAE